MNDLLKKINILHENRDYDQVYALVMEQLNRSSDDVDLWISLGIVIKTPPFGDEEIAIIFLKRALAIDPNNIRAVLVIAHTYEYQQAGIDDILLQRIEGLDTGSNELNSLLKYVASWSYSNGKKNNFEMQEKLLKESIMLCDKYVWNYANLARLYDRQKRYSEINPLIYKALSNIKKVYSDKNDYDITDIDEFINIHLKGIHTSLANVELLQEKFITTFS